MTESTMYTAGGADAQDEADIGSGIKPIIAQIQAYEDQYKSWMNRGQSIVQRYRDTRIGTATQPLNPLVQRKFNVLWSNVETLKPTLYARLPKIIVEREYKDRDPIAKTACEIAERAGNYMIKKQGLDEVLKQCTQDNLLTGRGWAFVDYQVEGSEQPVIDPMTGQPAIGPDGQPIMQFVKTAERAVPTYVNWEDMGHSPVRTWKEVKYLWRKIYLTKEECEARWPGKTVSLDRQPVNTKENTDTVVPQATIYVVYCLEDRTIKYLQTDSQEELSSQPPTIDYDHFWPGPRPLFATLTNETLQPVPDFYYYQDQADLLDKIVNRMARIIDAMKVGGVYDQNVGALARLFHPNGAPDNVLLPVDNWNAFNEKGGINGSFQIAPIDSFAATYTALGTAAMQVLETIYQITGISDIVRGASDPNETATAQGIKSNYANLRIKDRQQEVARFSRDIGAMIVECIVENFEPETIWEMTLAHQFCDRQQFDQAMQMLRNQKLRDFHIDIETDSTIALNDEVEKLQAREFIKVVAEFLTAWSGMVQQAPELMPLASEMLLYLVRRYRAGRSLESAVEQAMSALQQAAGQKGQQPTPEQQKLQAQAALEQQKAQTQMQLKQGQAQLDAQLDQQKAAREDQREAIQAQADMAVQRQKAELDMQLKREEFALDTQLKMQDAALQARLRAQGAGVVQ
jgi:hypothetical protein